MPITKEQTEKYIGTHGVRCPYCRSDNIESGSLDADGVEASALVKCFDCKRQWWDIWTLTSVQEID